VKITQTTNLRVEDYPDQSKWIGRLFTVLNALISELQTILDQNIDFSTNIRSLTRSYDTTAIQLPISFEWPYSAATPIEVRICKAMRGNDAIALIPAWDYNASTRSVSISSLHQVVDGELSAVTVGPRYRFTVRATV
jgi:hypothetical protein